MPRLIVNKSIKGLDIPSILNDKKGPKTVRNGIKCVIYRTVCIK